jgi:hypothetical protein
MVQFSIGNSIPKFKVTVLVFLAVSRVARLRLSGVGVEMRLDLCRTGNVQILVAATVSTAPRDMVAGLLCCKARR